MSFDFEFPEIEFQKIDICGLVQKMKSKKRNFLKIGSEVRQLDALIKNPPKTDECFKMLSVGGGFSSLAIIKYIADLETINELYVSTFRIGKAHFEILCRLKNQGKIGKAHFITSSTQRKTDDVMTYKGHKFNYFEFINQQCSDFGWQLKVFDNHSKLILMRTPENWYVVETSSNLNENPKMEQFSWENDENLYNWYLDLFTELLNLEE